jgi:hypothetical protein
MPNLRDSVIVFLEDLIENDLLEGAYNDAAEELLEALEDNRDGYGDRDWDEN